MIEDMNRKFSPSAEYMGAMHLSLKNDYESGDGRSVESCLAIACKVSELLIQEGGDPALHFVKGTNIDSDVTLARHRIIPRRYRGRVEWGRHTIVVQDDTVFDPMVSSKPILIEDYLAEAFEGENIIMVEAVSPEEVPGFLTR